MVNNLAFESDSVDKKGVVYGDTTLDGFMFTDDENKVKFIKAKEPIILNTINNERKSNT